MFHFFCPVKPILAGNCCEPNGTALSYRYDLKEIECKKKKHKVKQHSYLFHPLNLTQDAQGLTNTARGKISAHTNLKNQYVSMEKDSQRFSVICPNGTRRTYKALEGQKPEKVGPMKVRFFYTYLLDSEEFSNGNQDTCKVEFPGENRISRIAERQDV